MEEMRCYASSKNTMGSAFAVTNKFFKKTKKGVDVA
jgi:hypothetical protein